MAKLSIFDPISNGYINLDGGASSQISVQYQMLVEQRITNALLQQIADRFTDDVQNLRADQSVAEPQFAQKR